MNILKNKFILALAVIAAVLVVGTGAVSAYDRISFGSVGDGSYAVKSGAVDSRSMLYYFFHIPDDGGQVLLRTDIERLNDNAPANNSVRVYRYSYSTGSWEDNWYVNEGNNVVKHMWGVPSGWHLVVFVNKNRFDVHTKTWVSNLSN